ncbi:hypothetical protein VKT23_010681 [Stygiomarasmius scandens]|uniref:Uncharacterized protein n=1 Tax=Marasmiellus scandens TaxID=2682957 RepID=A0ABR1JAY0_9AGAR
MHKGIQRISVSYAVGECLHLPVLEILQLRSPDVVQLELDCSEVDGPQLLQLFENLPRLETLVLPTFASPSSAFEGLVDQMETLKNLQFRGRDITDKFQLPVIKTPLQCSPFQALESLHLDITYRLAASSLECRMPKLTTLSIRTHIVESREDIRTLCAAIKQKCYQITRLRLDYNASSRGSYTMRLEPPSLLDCDALFQCKNVTHFAFNHMNALSFSSSDIERLTSSWPELRSIVLRPASYSSCNVLLYFARNCPDIEHIGMSFDFETIPSDEQIRALPNTLRNLKTLAIDNWNLWGSIDQGSIILFLASICPPKLEIVGRNYGSEWCIKKILPTIVHHMKTTKNIVEMTRAELNRAKDELKFLKERVKVLEEELALEKSENASSTTPLPVKSEDIDASVILSNSPSLALGSA